MLNILSRQKSGIIDSTRTAVFSSRERHSSSRWKNLGYPQRSIRTRQYLYIRNFKPERWPSGTPPSFHDIDQAPERFVIYSGSDPRYAEYFRLATAKRPAEELYRSEEHTSELQSLMRISYAVFCLKKKNKKSNTTY